MSPLVLAKLVVVANGIDGMVAYDRTSGNEVWRFDVKGGVEGGATSLKDRNKGELIYFGANDGQVYCLRALDGKVVWTFAARSETLAAPTVEEEVVYVQTGTDLLFALEAASGKLLWTYNRQVSSNFSVRANTRPVVDAGVVLAGFSDGFMAAIRKRDGGLVWERKLGTGLRFRDVDATPVVDGETVYVSSFDGALYALNKRTGEIVWQVEDGGYVPVTLGTANALFYASTSGKLYRLDRRSGRTVWTRKLAQGIGTQPVLYKGYLIVGESEGAVLVLDSNSGEPVAQFDTGQGILARPTVIDATGEAYVMSNAANVYALKIGLVRRADRLPWDRQ